MGQNHKIFSSQQNVDLTFYKWEIFFRLWKASEYLWISC